jgi:hypothetical protein
LGLLAEAWNAGWIIRAPISIEIALRQKKKPGLAEEAGLCRVLRL